MDKGEKRRQAWRQSDKDLWADEEDDVEDPKLKQYYKYKKDRAKERDANENSIFTQVQRAFSTSDYLCQVLSLAKYIIQMNAERYSHRCVVMFYEALQS